VTTRLETAGDEVYLYDPDAPRRAGERWRAIARARVADEITLEAIRHQIRVSAERDDLVPRVASDGLVGVIGRPAQLFPTLAAAAVDLHLTIDVPGYLPLPLDGTLGPIAGFPDTFAALDLGSALLHRRGVAIEGRVVQNLTTAPPIAGASVAIEGVWSTLPPPNWTPPALEEAPMLVALDPGLYAPRGVATTIAQRNLVLSAQTKTLVLPLIAGAQRARISDRDGLGAGDVLVIDRDDPAHFEAIELAQVDSASSVDQPAWITLAHPAAHLHRDGAVCTAATPQAPINGTTFARAGIAGDPVAALAVVPAFASGVVVEVDDAITTREFQRIGVHATTSDADGYFRLPPIARVAFVRLRVQHAGFTDSTPIVTLDYRNAIQRVTVAME
jgi:hypothetical protein